MLSDDGAGRIVNISAATAVRLIPNGGIAAVANAAVQASTNYLATDAVKRQIRVNAVCPGMTVAGAWEQRLGEMARRQGSGRRDGSCRHEQHARHPLGMLAEPSEIADVVTFPASDLASYMTGQVVAVDGALSKAVG